MSLRGVVMTGYIVGDELEGYFQMQVRSYFLQLMRGSRLRCLKL